MTIDQKYIVYYHYVSVQLSLKHDFFTVDMNPYKKYYQKEWNNGLPEPNKTVYNTAFYKYSHNIHIPTFEQFTSKDNIWIQDNGEDWQSKGIYAQRYRTFKTGIYDWYWRFENEINLN